MRPRVIVIEGVDGSGKETQAKVLKENLDKLGYKTERISFPRYEDEASALVERYLSGEYGDSPDALSPYEAGLLYAMDRFDYFKKNPLDKIDVLICDRYTTSNMIHQAGKLEDKEEQDDFIRWLEDLEYSKLGIPKPDEVFFLNMPVEDSEALISKRSTKIGEHRDIHEEDRAYQSKVYNAAKALAKTLGWTQIECAPDGLREIDDIGREILERVKDVLEDEPV